MLEKIVALLKESGVHAWELSDVKLELLGKHMGMFSGNGQQADQENNLLEAILAATEGEVDTDDLPEIQQAAAAGHDLVEQTGTEKL